MNWVRMNLSNIFSILTAVCIGFILIILVNLQSTNAQRLEENSKVLKTQQQILDNLKAAVTDLKADNQRQTRFIECVLALHGANVQIDADVQAQCAVMSDNIKLQDVTRSSSSNSPPVATAEPAPTPVPSPTRKPVPQFVCNVISVLGLCKP